MQKTNLFKITSLFLSFLLVGLIFTGCHKKEAEEETTIEETTVESNYSENTTEKATEKSGEETTTEQISDSKVYLSETKDFSFVDNSQKISAVQSAGVSLIDCQTVANDDNGSVMLLKYQWDESIIETSYMESVMKTYLDILGAEIADEKILPIDDEKLTFYKYELDGKSSQCAFYSDGCYFYIIEASGVKLGTVAKLLNIK